MYLPSPRCIDWKSTNMAYECRAVPRGEGGASGGRQGQEPQGQGVTEWELVECRDMFPRQSCHGHL